jgi:hypothetical protein
MPVGRVLMEDFLTINRPVKMSEPIIAPLVLDLGHEFVRAPTA